MSGVLRRRAALAGLALGALGGACSSDVVTTAPKQLDRPADIAFGCVGVVEDSDGNESTVTLPTSVCGAGGADGGVPEEVKGSTTYGFAIESARGTAVVAKLGGYGEVRDSDPYSPGLNGLPVGRLPVAIDTTPDGCHAVTANQGSCDLGVIDVFGAVDRDTGVVSRKNVTVAAADPAHATLAAAPAAITMLPSVAPAARVTCGGTPSGLAYVAFPSCHLVGVVDLATGALTAGVRFAEGVAPEITGGDVSCPVECAELAAEAAVAAPAPGDAAEPTTLVMEPDGSRLYVGSWNSSELAIVSLDAGGLPTAVELLPLEQAGGVLRLAASGPEGMGQDDVAGTFHWVYAVAADASVRAIDVTPGRAPRECETQADPRWLRDVGDVEALSCLPIGAPREADAEGPGIRLPRGAVPEDVAFLRGIGAGEIRGAAVLNGLFAVVTAQNPVDVGTDSLQRGVAYYINVNDENYPDFVSPSDVGLVDVSLARAHVLRDNVDARSSRGDACGEPVVNSADLGPVRLFSDPVLPASVPGWLTYNSRLEAPIAADARIAPMLHREYCECTTTGCTTDKVPVWGLSPMAPIEARQRVLADLGRTPTETWRVSWQGPLTGNGITNERNGGEIRVEGPVLKLRDAAGDLCAIGIEPYDTVRLLGCTADFECGSGATCFVHAEAPPGIGGLCLPAGYEQVTDECRAILTSERSYTAVQVGAGELVLASKPWVLDWTPVDGCTSNEQCAEIREAQVSFLEAQGSLAPGSQPRYRWGCVTDPSFRGVARCVAECDPAVATDCPAGRTCQAGRCVFGPIPPQVCVSAVQRYEVQAADAFTVVGSRTGYLHHRVVDPATGLCMDDPTASPLLVGRFHLDEPACAGDSVTELTPNPCRVTLSEPTFETVSGTKVPTLREADGVRFRSVGLTFEIADVTSELLDVPGVRYMPAPRGAYSFLLPVAGGYLPRAALLDAAIPGRVRPGPDGSLWILDLGDDRTIGRHGQIIHFTAGANGKDGFVLD